jgi:hypothetical protein
VPASTVVPPQEPATQLTPLGQALPQAPQFCESVWRFLQPAGVWQHVMPAVQALPALHEQVTLGPLFRQASPCAHVEPPQWQIPLSQDPPFVHWLASVHPQSDPAHLKPPLAPWAAQLLLQLPQRCVELEKSVSHASSGPVGDLTQSPKPALHVCSQVVPLQVAALALTVVQACVQSPHACVVLSACSQPLPAFRSQLPKPAVHAKSAH